MYENRRIVDAPLGIEHQIFWVKLTAILTPGSSATANVVMPLPDGTYYTSSMTTTIYDNFHRYGGSDLPYGQNYGLVGEVFKCRRNPQSNRDECVGSQGLRRRGVTDAKILEGASGEVSLWHSQDSADCEGTDASVNVTACALATVQKGVSVYVTYHPEFKSWLISPVSGGRMNYIGETANDAAHTADTWADYHVYRLDDAGTPVELTGDDALTINCYNPTGVSLKQFTMCGIWQVDGDPDEDDREHYVFPIELEACIPDDEIGDQITQTTGDYTLYTASGVRAETNVKFSKTTANTTDATVTSAFTLTSASDTSYLMRAWVIATETVDHDETAGYGKAGVFKNDGGTLTQIGSTANIIADREDTAGWHVIWDDDGAGVIRLRVTGAASTNINWEASIEYTEVT
jgi:hypothetical protein